MMDLELGRDMSSGEDVSISPLSRREGCYVIGKTGTGKSTLLINMMVQDMDAGLGLCVIDPHRDLVSDLLPCIPQSRRYHDDVLLIDLLDPTSGFGLNPFECTDTDSDVQVAQVLDGVMQAFQRLWGSSMWETPLLADYLRNTATVMILTGSTMVDLGRFIRPNEFAYRKSLLSSLPDRYSYLRDFWTDHEDLAKPDKARRLQSLSIRVRAFTDNPLARSIFSKRSSSIVWRDVMDEGKIVLVTLDPLMAWLTSFIGSVILGQILGAAASRSDIGFDDRSPFALYVDEYQEVATPATTTLLKGGRKFGVMTTISHQVRADLDEATKAATLQAGTLIVFGVTGDDARELAPNFDYTPPPPLVTGQRPVLTVTNDPLRTLSRQGHANPHTRALFSQGLEHLVNHADRLGTTHTIHSGSVDIEKNDLERYIDIINRYLVSSMQGKFKNDVIGEARELSFIAAAIAPYTGISIYGSAVPRELYYPLFLHMLFPPFRIQDSYGGFIVNQWILLAGDDEDKAEVIKNRNTVAQLVHKQMSGFDFEEYLVNPAANAMTEILKIAGILKLPYKEVQIWADRWLNEMFRIAKLAHALAKEPIMGDSGSHEPIFERPRMYSDVQSQVANLLANLSRYSAMVRLSESQHTIGTLPPPQPVGAYTPPALPYRVDPWQPSPFEETPILEDEPPPPTSLRR